MDPEPSEAEFRYCHYLPDDYKTRRDDPVVKEMLDKLESGGVSYGLKVHRISPDATLPMRGSLHSAGLDLFSLNDFVVRPGAREIISTGIRVEFPRGTYGKIESRSGLAVKGIDVKAGVIDEDYRGEIKVVLKNDGLELFVIKRGMRIAQLLIQRYDAGPVIEVFNLPDTMRDTGGFGSTGK